MAAPVIEVTIAAEGLSDVPVARKILTHAGLQPGHTYVSHGKGNLDRRLRGYNSAARFTPWLVIRDLDHDADCVGDLVATLVPARSRWMRLQVAVRETEAWLLADENIARYLRIPRHLVPHDPEALADPKATLVGLARRSSSAAIRAEMAPRLTAPVGPAYVSRISEFASQHWSIADASSRSPSLRRCLTRVAELQAWTHRSSRT